MMTAKVLLDDLCDQMNNPRGTADEAYRKTALRKLNQAYRDICACWPWPSLKTKATLTDESYIVPSDCMLIQDVRDEDDYPYSFIDGPNRPSDFNYNWYFDTPVATVLASGTTLIISEYSKTVSSTEEFPATTCADEYIRIASNPGVYKIATWTSTSAITLKDYFRDIAQSSVYFEIRPLGTPILNFADAAGNALTPSGVVITYIREALPLFRDWDVLELPGDCEAVYLKALQSLLALQGYNQAADRLENRITAALSRMKSIAFSTPIVKPTSMFKTNTMSKESLSYMRGLSLLNS